MKTHFHILFIVCFALMLTACQAAECPPERITYIDDLSFFPAEATVDESGPSWVQIKNKEIQVDQVITGPVCNNILKGTVYLTCDIQIPAWEDNPFFFQDCDFDVEEGPIVFVEAHNDKRYDKGCSCHE